MRLASGVTLLILTGFMLTGCNSDSLVGPDSAETVFVSGGDGTNQAVGGDGTNQAVGGDGTNQAVGGDGTNQAVGGDGTNQGIGGDGTNQ